MNRVIKGLAIAAAVAAAGGIGFTAVAETAGPHGFMGDHMGMGPGMMGMHDGTGPHGFGDPTTHLATLKTGLAIRPEQTAAWDAYAKVVQDSATKMQAMHASIDFDALQTMPWQEHQAYIGKLHDQRAQAIVAVKTAANTLLTSLDDAQKTKARTELPGLVAHGPGMMAQHGGMAMPNGPMDGAGAAH